mgnify:CR=1 FL=1
MSTRISLWKLTDFEKAVGEKMFADSRPDRLVPCSYPEVKWTQPAGIDLETWFLTKGSPAVEVVSFHAVAGLKDGKLVIGKSNAIKY